MEDIVWGSIGCGNVMEVKSGPALQGVKHSDLGAVMRRDGRLAEDFAKRHGIPLWYTQASDLINDPIINAIYIATPPSTHLEYARMAAEAGKPVYVEKPMANSYQECLEMVNVCNEHQVPLFVAYYRRALPRFLRVKEIINSGIIGEIQSVNIRLLYKAKPVDISGDTNWRVDPEIAGCGYFCDLGSHMIDLLQFLIGDIETATGKLNRPGKYYAVEDRIDADIRFTNGVKAKGLWDFDAAENLDRTKIIGSKGSVSYTHFAEANVELKTSAKEEIFEVANPRHIQQPLIQQIVDELRGHGQSPSTGITAAETNRIMDQILGRL